MERGSSFPLAHCPRKLLCAQNRKLWLLTTYSIDTASLGRFQQKEGALHTPHPLVLLVIKEEESSHEFRK